MGIYQNTVFQRAEAYGPVGSRVGDGHRPAIHYRNSPPVAQVDSVTLVDNSNGTTWTVLIDGISFSVADSSTTGAADFVAAINAHATASQIVRATLSTSLIFLLTARNAGTAFTCTTSVAGGTSTATRASVTANSAGQALSAGMPVFQSSGASSASLVALPAAMTDRFVGLVQFRHEDAELEQAHSASLYPAGSQVPVDPNGKHVVIASTAVSVGDPVFVTLTTGAFSNDGVGATRIRLHNAQWKTAATAGNKAVFDYDTPSEFGGS